MYEEETVRAGSGCSGFGGSEVAARLGLLRVERRFAQEDVRAVGELSESRGRACVGGERRDLASCLDAKAPRRLRVVRNPNRRDGETCCLERRRVCVLLDLEHVVEARGEVVEVVASTRWEPELRGV